MFFQSQQRSADTGMVSPSPLSLHLSETRMLNWLIDRRFSSFVRIVGRFSSRVLEVIGRLGFCITRSLGKYHDTMSANTCGGDLIKYIDSSSDYPLSVNNFLVDPRSR